MQSSVGLKSWIWANNFKSTLLLVMFPFMLAALFFIGVYFFVWSNVPLQYSMQPNTIYNEAVLSQAVTLTLHALPAILGGAGAWVLIATLFNTWLIRNATGSRSVSRQEEPELYNLLENLCISRGLPMPRLEVIESGALNAYASGLTKDSFAVTVTRGLMQTLDRDEMEGVLGHELTHIMNRDVRLLIVTTVFVGMISFFSQMAWRAFTMPSYSTGLDRGRRSNIPIMLIATVLLAVGYLLALILRFAISRKREYVADAGSVELTKNPAAMASALRKISGMSDVTGVPPEVKQMFIENKAGVFGELFGLFATHPPIKKRIALLESMADRKHVSKASLSGGSVPSAGGI